MVKIINLQKIKEDDRAGQQKYDAERKRVESATCKIDNDYLYDLAMQIEHR